MNDWDDVYLLLEPITPKRKSSIPKNGNLDEINARIADADIVKFIEIVETYPELWIKDRLDYEEIPHGQKGKFRKTLYDIEKSVKFLLSNKGSNAENLWDILTAEYKKELERLTNAERKSGRHDVGVEFKFFEDMSFMEMFPCCQCGKFSRRSEVVAVPTDEEMLKQWEQQYELQLNLKDDVDNYVCRTHVLEEVKPPDVEIPEFMETGGAEFSMEVKDEVEEPVLEGPLDLWEDAKPEGVEDTQDYESYPFDMEQNSFSTFDDTSFNYTEECQPSTSSAPIQTSYTRGPVLYPEVSDTQILAFCVKNSSNVSGESVLQCGMCPDVLTSMDTGQIRAHLKRRHVKTMETFVSQGYSDRAPKSFEPMDDATISTANKALCTFIIRNGLSVKILQDRNLEMLAFNMNSEYQLPTAEVLYEFMQEVADSRQNSKIDKRGGPMTVSFDTVSFNNTHYVAFTIGYFQNAAKMKNCVFLQEMESKLQAPAIIKTIKNTIDETEISLPIASVVAGKSEFEDSLEEMGCFKHVIVCFSESMNKFVEALINHPVFLKTLKTLRTFIQSFPTNRACWSRFKSFIVKRRTYGEYPELDEGHWFTTLDFLTKCLHMHRLFSEFSSMNANLQYIGVDDNVNMVYLHSLLGLCKSLLKQLADTKATVSDVIPLIAEINASIGITTSRPEVVAVVSGIFCRTFVPIVEQSDVHRFAMFLHPLHSGGSMFAASEWEKIRNSFSRQLATSADGVPLNQLGDNKKFTSFRDSTSTNKEVQDYVNNVHHSNNTVSSRIDSALEWWYRNSKKYPTLFKYAKEILPIPAFSIDASHYFGDYGILTHAIQETEVSKRKLLLLASSELVDYHPKGDVMTRQICVKRKRDPACPDDAWYSPIDMRPFRAPEEVHPYVLDARVGNSIQQLPLTPSNYSAYQAKLLAARTHPLAQHPPQRTLKQEIEMHGTKLPQKTTPRTYTVAEQYPKVAGPKPAVIKRILPTMPPPAPKVALPTTTKKYYAVRSAAPNSGNGVRPVTQPRIIRRFPIILNHQTQGTVPTTKKVYFVRPKTSQQPQPRT